MTTTKMTVQQVDALKAREAPYKINVDTGLQIRISPKGVKTLIVQYVVNGKQRECRLPKPWGVTTDAGHFSLRDARIESEKIRALARQNIDHQIQQEHLRRSEARAVEEEKIKANAQRERALTEKLTVNDLYSTWLLNGVRRKDGNAELRRSFSKDVLPEIGDKCVKDVTEDDVRRLLRKLVHRGANRLAVLTSGNVTQMFLWAEKRQPWRSLLAACNPVELIEIEKIVSPDYDISNERDRTLSEAEIRELFQKFSAVRLEYAAAKDRRIAPRPVVPATELAIWIMLSTLCRVGELSIARWEHVNFEESTWFLPRKNTKGSVGKQSDLTIFLSDFAVKQFQRLHEISGNSEWCFPASHKASHHLCVKTISKQVGDRQTMFKRDRLGSSRKILKNRTKDEDFFVLSNGVNGAWTPHDLRRTGATMMQSLGIALEIIDRCQNHVLPGSKVRRHYMHHDYAEEKRLAWRLLGERIVEIVSPR